MKSEHVPIYAIPIVMQYPLHNRGSKGQLPWKGCARWRLNLLIHPQAESLMEFQQ